MTAKSKILAKNLVKKLAIMLAPFDHITLLLLSKFANHRNKRPFVLTANGALLGILMTMGDVNEIFPQFWHSLVYSYRYSATHLTKNLAISCCCFADDGNEMDKSEKRTCRACKAIVFTLWICKFVTFSLPSPLSLLKLPILRISRT